MNDRLVPPRVHSRRYILRALRDELNTVAREFVPAPCPLLVDFGAGEAPYRPLFASRVGRYLPVDLPGRAGADRETVALREAGLEDGSADVVLSTQVLEHASDPRAYLDECCRLLKAGGVLVLSTHGHWPYHPDPSDYWRWTRAGLEKTVTEAGFRILRVRGLMGIAPTGAQLMQDALAQKLPAPLRPAFHLLMQSAIALLDRLHSQDDRDRDASVFVVVAAKAGL